MSLFEVFDDFLLDIEKKQTFNKGLSDGARDAHDDFIADIYDSGYEQGYDHACERFYSDDEDDVDG